MTTQNAIERSNTNTLATQPSEQQPQMHESSRWHYSPHADVYETGEEFVITLEMPGVRPEDVDITCEQRMLIVHGRVEQPVNNSRRPIRTEYGIGDYFRRFTLSDSIDAGRITAHCTPQNSGVVVVHLPKIEQARPTKIKVLEQ